MLKLGRGVWSDAQSVFKLGALKLFFCINFMLKMPCLKFSNDAQKHILTYSCILLLV